MSTVISDILRFTNSLGQIDGGSADRMIFYSDKGEDVPADTGFPERQYWSQNVSFFTETGFEGGVQLLDLDYGFPKDNRYLGISDTPEPSALAIAGLGGLCMAVYARRRRAASH